MAKYMKKGSLGMLSEAPGGASDPDLIEVRYSVSEYNEMMQELSSLRRQLLDEKAAHQRDVKDINARAVRYKSKADAEAQRKVDDALSQIARANARAEAAEAEKQRQANLNNNLLRITRERANAKRGLQPKKEHSGYRFSGKIMQKKTICGHDKKEGALYADVWTATLETPYNGTIPIHQIEDRIFADLMGSDGILNRLYINYWTCQNDSGRIWKGKYQDAVGDDNPGKKNYLFDYKFIINPKSQLWEVQITTTKSIRALSELMK